MPMAYVIINALYRVEGHLDEKKGDNADLTLRGIF